MEQEVEMGRKNRSKVVSVVTVSILLTASLVLAALSTAGCGAQPLTLGTTQSVVNSGLLAKLLPAFEKKYNAKVTVVSSATNMGALDGAKKGNAGVLLVGNKMADEEFVKAGYGEAVVPVMYSDLLIVGPASDPAAVKGFDCPGKSSKQIATKQALYVSRGDGSDVNMMEMGYWTKNGVGDPTGKTWYIKTGEGMVQTLKTASDKQGYVLVDRATWLKNKGNLNLVELVQGCSMLMNPHCGIVVNSAKVQAVKDQAKLANDFVAFCTSAEGQKIIGSYKKTNVVLYHPDATKTSNGTTPASTTTPGM
jgi:tungstate transport system substrate-binding protein